MQNASYAATEKLASSMPDDHGNDSKREARISAEEFDERKRFCRFAPEDAALLSELAPIFEKHADSVVDRFYDHLTHHPVTRALLSSEDMVGRLRGFQREYLLSLVSGRYDEVYATNRLTIGRVHDRIGLDPEWYLGTYGLYLDLLLPLIHERFGAATDRAVAASSALAKLLILDMQLVLDAYYGKRQQRAVEHSAQLAAIGELAASIAHEVRNPLAGMKGALQILRRGIEPANQEIVGELLEQIDRLEQLVRDLLTYARPRAPSRQLFDLHELLDRLLRICSDESAARSITVQHSYGPGTGQVLADPGQLEQVFLNLIHNALQAMPDGGELTVATRAGDGEIVISFQDAGRGIPPENLPRVLQPFFTTKHRGSGLGLSIVSKITEAHGGRLQIQSEVGRGTTVTVRIPDSRKQS